MKKSYKLIPIISIVVVLCAAILTAVFTTSLTADLCGIGSYTEATSDEGETVLEPDDYFYKAKRVGRIMQIAYKLNPSLENLENLTEIYNPQSYILGTYKENTPTEDYLEKSVKYWALLYDSEYVPEESTKAFPYSVEDIGYDSYKIEKGINYAKALFLNGQIDESKQLFDGLCTSVIPTQCKETSPEANPYYDFVFSLRDYLYLVFSHTDSTELKQWVIDEEKKIEEVAKRYNATKVYAISYIAKNGSLFSNPDYDTYVSGSWLPVDEIEPNVNDDYVYYFNKVREFDNPSGGTTTGNTRDFYYNHYEGYEYANYTEFYTGDRLRELTKYSNFSGFENVKDDSLYGVRYTHDYQSIGKVEGHPLANYDRESFNINTCLFLSLTSGGIAVVNRNEIVLLNEIGEIEKTYCKISDGEITAFCLSDNLIWFVAGNKIYRLFTPSCTLDLFYEGVDAEHFSVFLKPISNYEIQWIQFVHGGKYYYVSTRAYYYNSKDDKLVVKEYVPDSQPQELIDPREDWWNRADDHYIEPDAVVTISVYSGAVQVSLEASRNSNQSYFCRPEIKLGKNASEKDRTNAELIKNRLSEIATEFYSNYESDSRRVYYIETRYENADGKTVITLRGEYYDPEKGEYIPYEKVLTFDFVLTDIVKNLNPWDTNYFK